MHRPVQWEGGSRIEREGHVGAGLGGTQRISAWPERKALGMACVWVNLSRGVAPLVLEEVVFSGDTEERGSGWDSSCEGSCPASALAVSLWQLCGNFRIHLVCGSSGSLSPPLFRVFGIVSKEGWLYSLPKEPMWAEGGKASRSASIRHRRTHLMTPCCSSVVLGKQAQWLLKENTSLRASFSTGEMTWSLVNLLSFSVYVYIHREGLFFLNYSEVSLVERI